jgi:lipoyl(octanoyl) transferase
MNTLRLVIDTPAAGAWNMAVDEALLETAAASGLATLRFYQWSEPTLSLGYFQAAADRQLHPPSLACPLVRRASGGGAILHDKELTYSLAVAGLESPVPAARRLYDVMHNTLIVVLGELGIQAQLYGSIPTCCERPRGEISDEAFLCFERRTCMDIVCGPAKIVGSAQRRRRGAVLQHGSILLSRSTFAPELPGIGDVTGKAIDCNELIRRWPPRLAEQLGYFSRSAELAQPEILQAQALEAARFASCEYLSRR